MPEKLNLGVEYRPVSSLTANPRNTRTHSDKQLAQIRASIKRFGFTNPLIVDETGQVIAGHGRLLAAQQDGLETVPVIELSHLTTAKKRALAIADNKIALNAGWDLDLLREELIELSGGELEFDLDLSEIGFDTAEADLIIDGSKEEKERSDPLDVLDAIDRTTPSIAQLGDLWKLGGHRLFVGSALEAASYETLMQGESADQVVTDPPYNVAVDGHVGGLGKLKHAEFAMASGEMSVEEFTSFLTTSFDQMVSNARDGAVVMSFMDWRHCTEILAASKTVGLSLLNICAWVKSNGGMGSLYRSQHEFCFIFKKGAASHINNVELGKHGRYRTNVWEYAGANTFRRGRKEDLATHPTVKPIAMIVDAIKDCSHRGDVILDPFGGSGTTLLAAERTGRRARLIELDPYYVDATIRRWQKMTGKTATNAETQQSFAEDTADAA